MGAINNFVDNVARASVALRALLGGSSGQDFAVKKLTAADTITPHTTKGIVGTTTNDSAQAGSVGEYKEAIVVVGSPVSLTDNVNANLTSLSLTAGDWDVCGAAGFFMGATTNYTTIAASVSLASATQGNVENAAYMHSPGEVIGNKGIVLCIPETRISLTAPAAVYIVLYSRFTVSTMSAFGKITARRVR